MLENVVKHSEFGYTREQRYIKVIYYYYYIYNHMYYFMISFPPKNPKTQRLQV